MRLYTTLPNRAVLPVLGALFLALFTSCAERTTQLTLRVASDLDNMPFAGVDEEGTAVGRDVEMMEELCRRAGFALAWERMPFAELMPSVQAGEVDAVCATLGVTPERSRLMRFSRPYYRTRLAVVVPVDGVGSLSELAGKVVSGAPGTTSERAVRESLPDAILAESDDKDRSTEERLLAGALAAAVMDGPAAEALVARNPERLDLLEEDLGGEEYAIAMPLESEGLARALDQALAELEASGWLDELDRRHGLEAGR